MKVIQVCPMFPYYGGLERHVLEISRRLLEAGIEVEVYATDPAGGLPKREIVENMQVSRLRSFAPRNVYFYAPKLREALEKVKDADLVHVHSYQAHPSLAASKAKKANKKPLIFTPHYHPVGGTPFRSLLHFIYHPFGREIFKRSDRVIAITNYEKELLHKTFSIPNEKIAVIPNGIDVKKFGAITRRNEIQDTKTILHVGRLERYKGVQHLLNVLPDLRKAYSMQLIVAGTGPYEKSLKSLTYKLGLQNVVKFLGTVSEEELLDLYRNADMFVILSRYEAFCLSLVEAMASALPVISTRVGGIPDIIQNGVNGFLLDYPPREERVSELIRRLLSDKALPRKIGSQARKSVLTKFSWRDVTRGLIRLYEEQTE